MKSFLPILCALSVSASLQQPLAPDGFQVYYSAASPGHAVRIKKQNDSLCDARSNQYTGWLDFDTKHLFFHYFESQRNPAGDPLTLWLNGGPGASSMLGLFQELGPCLVNDNGTGTIHNEYGWSRQSNLLFVDQPASVGFSYADNGTTTIGSSEGAAQDMHIFLQAFVSQVFPHLIGAPLHLSGESYAGHYLPTLGAEIIVQNMLHPSRPKINLESILMGNGYVSLRDSYAGYWETLCTTNPGVNMPIFNHTRCNIMAENTPRCLKLMDICYATVDPTICDAAGAVCDDGVLRFYQDEVGIGGRNLYDITAPCDVEGLCYAKSEMVVKYLNSPAVWKALSVPKDVPSYKLTSDAVSDAFGPTGDVLRTMQAQVQYLLANQIHFLFYQGNLDLVSNTAGLLRWAHSMPWSGQAELFSKSLKPWSTKVRHNSVKAGTFKTVTKRMGPDERRTTFAIVTIDNAGHLVPQDQPDAALDMFERWISGSPFEW